MFGIGLPEMILIMALALIVVGPDKLPDLARSVAKGVLELKKTVSALKKDLVDENPFDAVKPELEEAADSIKKQLGEVTPDGFSGIVKDLEEGLQEVIDKDGTVIPVTTDDIINTVTDSPSHEPEHEDPALPSAASQSVAEGETSADNDVAAKTSEPVDEEKKSPDPDSPA